MRYEFVTSSLMLQFVAPSGPPQSLRIISTTLSNVTIQWDEVSCLERNGPIGNYIITVTSQYYWPLTSTEGLLRYATNRVYTVLNLQPHSTYTVTVRAVSFDNFSHSDPSASESIIANTATPLGMKVGD